MHIPNKVGFVKSIILSAALGLSTIALGCTVGQRQVGDQKDYVQLAEQVKQCDKMKDQASIDDCRNALVEPLSDEEKEKLVDQLQATGYYPQ